MSQLLTYTYNNQTIDFDISHKKLMVNATEMAKIFDKQVVAFLRNDQTKLFIKECINSDNSHFLNVHSEEDLYTSVQKSGTWMHRILALKFAAWLNPKFELWVFSTIDKLLFGEYYRLKEELTQSAVRKSRIEELEITLSDNSDYQELKELKQKERQSAYRRGKVIKEQLFLFKDQL